MEVRVNGAATGVNIWLGKALYPPNRAIVFDCADLEASMPGGAPELSVRRPGEVGRYTAPLSVSGADARWTISAGDISRDGIGECELRWIVSGNVKKTTVFLTTISSSDNQQTPTPPAFEPGWFEAVMEAAALISNNISAADIAAQNAGQSADRASSSAQSAGQSADRASSSAQSAGQSADRASSSATSAGQSADRASSSAQSAGQSADRASASAQSAGQSANRAETVAIEAEKAFEKIKTEIEDVESRLPESLIDRIVELEYMIGHNRYRAWLTDDDDIPIAGNDGTIIMLDWRHVEV